MSVAAVATLSALVALVSGGALMAGLGGVADRVALVLLCWSTMSVPISLAVGQFIKNGSANGE